MELVSLGKIDKRPVSSIANPDTKLQSAPILLTNIEVDLVS